MCLTWWESCSKPDPWTFLQAIQKPFWSFPSAGEGRRPPFLTCLAAPSRPGPPGVQGAGSQMSPACPPAVPALLGHLTLGSLAPRAAPGPRGAVRRHLGWHPGLTPDASPPPAGTSAPTHGLPPGWSCSRSSTRAWSYPKGSTPTTRHSCYSHHSCTSIMKFYMEKGEGFKVQFHSRRCDGLKGVLQLK